MRGKEPSPLEMPVQEAAVRNTVTCLYHAVGGTVDVCLEEKMVKKKITSENVYFPTLLQ